MNETTSGSYKHAFEQAQEMHKAGDFELALSQIDAIIEVHPRAAKTSVLKGVAFRHLGRHEKAVDILQRLAQATEGVAAVHQELGFSLYALFRVEEAIDALRAAVKIDSKLAASWASARTLKHS